jgi:drug/metabolite transporter (DMT)-like permease
VKTPPITFAAFMKTATKGHLAVLMTNIFFASNYSVIKIIAPKLVGPYALNVLRVAISLVLFWTVWLFGATEAGIRKKDIPRFLLCALTGIAINQTLFIKGLTLTSTIHASLLILVTPIAVTIFALWVLKEQFTFFKALGLALGIGGAVFLVLQKEAVNHASDYLLGDILVIINAISYSVYFILVKPLMKNYSPLHVIRWIFTIGFLMILPFGWAETTMIEWSNFQWYHYLCLASVTITGTFLAYYFNVYGIQTIGASMTGSYIYTQPFFVAAIAIIFLGEVLTWQKILAAVLILAGVFLVSYKTAAGPDQKAG